MPELGALHPQIIHFVVALLILGVFFRWLSLTGRLAWTRPTAASLLLLGTVASVFAVSSGHDAHGPVERIPGVRPAVVEHEEWGERTRNIFLVVAALELVILATGATKVGRMVQIASAVVGTVGAASLYETAEHGGKLVYSYAGGIGTRTGDPADVERLLVAGLYQQGLADREAGRAEGAARLFAELGRRVPDDINVQLLAIESRMRDGNDPAGARDALAAVLAPADNPGVQARIELLRVDIYGVLGFPDSARSLLETLERVYPDNRRVRAKIAELRE